MIEVRALTDELVADAESVIRDRFSEDAVDLLHKEMKNPIRREFPIMGYIGYEEGKPAAFEAQILRRLYWEKNPIIGSVGGMSCLKKGAAPEVFVDVRIATVKPYADCRIWFGNSQNRETALIAHKSKLAIEGPESCTRYLWRPIRPWNCGMYFIRRKLLKAAMPRWKNFSTLSSRLWSCETGGFRIARVADVDGRFFDALMARYVRSNTGIFCSRTAEEIEWIFGEKIRTGEAVVLGTLDNEGPLGYILLKSDRLAKRWAIHDWFAVDNCLNVLEALLQAACRFLRAKTPAMMLETFGFPTGVQSLLRKYLPYVRAVGHNQFSWGSWKMDRKGLCEVLDSPASWFFGPYDGDACLCM